MTGVLKRLVAHATGQAASRLRPRPRSRFETPSKRNQQDALALHEETLVRRPAVNEAAPEAIEVPDDGPRDPMRAAPQRSAERSSGDRRTVEATPAEPARESAPDPLSTRREPALPRRLPGRALSFPFEASEDGTTTPGAESRMGAGSPGAGRRGGVGVRAQAPVADEAGAPAPLIPGAEDAPPEGFARISTPPAARPLRRTSFRQQAEPAPPDITIHIGRIDLRSETAKPERRPRRSRPETKLTSLGDYLKNGAGSQ